MTTILHKRGTGTPSADDLSVGEIALDTSVGTAYTKLSDGTVVEIGGSAGGGGGGDVDLTGYATETWVSDNYQIKGTYLTNETDPVFQASVAAGITQTDINNWNSNSGGGGGDVDLTGYATETWVSANYQVKGNYLTSGSLNGYATQSWVSSNYQPKGNYLTGFTESDPTVPQHVKNITQTDIANWNSVGGNSPNFNSNIIVNGNGVQPTILMKAPAPRGPELQWAHGLQNKYIRLNSSGTLEMVSSSYSGVIFSWDDGGTFYCKAVSESSDASFKSNIKTVSNNIVSQLIGREWEDKETGATCSGVVAQEVEEVVPHLVDTNEEGLKSVRYSGLIAYLIEEVKSLRNEIEALKA